jgi:hypothetical protein
MPVVLLYHPNIFIWIKLLDQLLKNEICKYKPEGLAPYILLFIIIFSDSAAQRGLWPPVALQPSAGYGLIVHEVS